jgi:DNA-binding XRE family transcriptional regulator
MNQEDLATNAQVDRKHMSSIENGKTEPGIWTVTRIASVLGTTPAQLVRGLTWIPDKDESSTTKRDSR